MKAWLRLELPHSGCAGDEMPSSCAYNTADAPTSVLCGVLPSRVLETVLQATSPRADDLISSRGCGSQAAHGLFPTAAAWKYLSCAEEHTRGLPELSDVLTVMRHNCVVLAEKGAVAHRRASSAAFEPFTRQLRLDAIALVDFLPHLVVPRATAATLEAARPSSPSQVLQSLAEPMDAHDSIRDMRVRVCVP